MKVIKYDKNELRNMLAIYTYPSFGNKLIFQGNKINFKAYTHLFPPMIHLIVINQLNVANINKNTTSIKEI